MTTSPRQTPFLHMRHNCGTTVAQLGHISDPTRTELSCHVNKFVNAHADIAPHYAATTRALDLFHRSLDFVYTIVVSALVSNLCSHISCPSPTPTKGCLGIPLPGVICCSHFFIANIKFSVCYPLYVDFGFSYRILIQGDCETFFVPIPKALKSKKNNNNEQQQKHLKNQKETLTTKRVSMVVDVFKMLRFAF